MLEHQAKQNDTPTLVQEAMMEPALGAFDVLQYFRTVLPLVESL